MLLKTDDNYFAISHLSATADEPAFLTPCRATAPADCILSSRLPTNFLPAPGLAGSWASAIDVLWRRRKIVLFLLARLLFVVARVEARRSEISRRNEITNAVVSATTCI